MPEPGRLSDSWAWALIELGAALLLVILSLLLLIRGY